MTIINKENIKKIVKIFNEDGVIAYPTDTVYGLGVRYDSKQAKQNLINKKNRPEEKSFPIMVSSLKMMKNIAVVKKRDELIINEFMPGPLTVILNKKDSVEDWINDGRDTLAIRIACDDFIKGIIEELGVPIFLTSANKSNLPVCKNAEEIMELKLADLIIRGNPKNEIASTIVDLSKEEISILRNGPISIEEIKDIINK